MLLHACGHVHSRGSEGGRGLSCVKTTALWLSRGLIGPRVRQPAPVGGRGAPALSTAAPGQGQASALPRPQCTPPPACAPSTVTHPKAGPSVARARALTPSENRPLKGTANPSSHTPGSRESSHRPHSGAHVFVNWARSGPRPPRAQAPHSLHGHRAAAGTPRGSRDRALPALPLGTGCLPGPGLPSLGVERVCSETGPGFGGQNNVKGSAAKRHKRHRSSEAPGADPGPASLGL